MSLLAGFSSIISSFAGARCARDLLRGAALPVSYANLAAQLPPAIPAVLKGRRLPLPAPVTQQVREASPSQLHPAVHHHFRELASTFARRRRRFLVGRVPVGAQVSAGSRLSRNETSTRAKSSVESTIALDQSQDDHCRK